MPRYGVFLGDNLYSGTTYDSMAETKEVAEKYEHFRKIKSSYYVAETYMQKGHVTFAVHNEKGRVSEWTRTRPEAEKRLEELAKEMAGL